MFCNGLIGILVTCYVVGICLADTEAPKNIYTVTEHSNFTVTCNAIVTPAVKVFWTNNSTLSTFYQEGQMLILNDVTRKEAGQYVCHALNTSQKAGNRTERNRIIESIAVDVQYPAKILNCSLMPPTLMANQSFWVYYDVRGNPPPTWQIRYNMSGEIVYESSNASQGIAGPFPARCGYDDFIMCTGRNQLNEGHNVTKGDNLSILCPPAPETRVGPQSPVVLAYMHFWALFIYDFVGNPKPIALWEREDGTPLPWERAVQYDGWGWTALNISKVQVTDFTNYTLTLVNNLGNYTTRYTVISYGAPDTPINLTYSDVTNDTVTLHWTSGFDKCTKQYFQIYNMAKTTAISGEIHRPYSNHGVGQNFTHTLKGLSSGTTYKLSVMAGNDDFQSDLSRPVTFTTKGTSPSHSPSRETYIIVGAALGGVAMVVALVVVVNIIKRRRARGGYEQT